MSAIVLEEERRQMEAAQQAAQDAISRAAAEDDEEACSNTLGDDESAAGTALPEFSKIKNFATLSDAEPPPADKPWRELGLDDLLARLREDGFLQPGVADRMAARITGINRLVSRIRSGEDMGATPDKRRLVGQAMVDLRHVAKQLHLTAKPVAIIVAGYEKSTKTTLVECLLQRRIGFSNDTRATACPVEYHLILVDDLPEGESRCFIGHTLAELEQRDPRCALAETQIPGYVESHMRRILGPQNTGLSADTLYVRIEASDLLFVGIIIDTPGVVLSPKAYRDAGASAKLEEYSVGVQDMIKKKISELSPENAFVLCVERFDMRHEDQRFRTNILGDIPDDRLICVYSKHDAKYNSRQATDSSTTWEREIAEPGPEQASWMATRYQALLAEGDSCGGNGGVPWIITMGGIHALQHDCPSEGVSPAKFENLRSGVLERARQGVVEQLRKGVAGLTQPAQARLLAQADTSMSVPALQVRVGLKEEVEKKLERRLRERVGQSRPSTCFFPRRPCCDAPPRALWRAPRPSVSV